MIVATILGIKTLELNQSKVILEGIIKIQIIRILFKIRDK